MAPTLYSDDGNEHWYLVPDGVDLPEGPLRLYSWTKGIQHVDPAAVAPHEVSEDEAKEALRELLTAGVNKLGGWMRGLGEAVAQRMQRAQDPDVIAHRAALDAQHARVAKALGLSGADALRDPDAVAAGLKRLQGELLDAAEATRGSASEAELRARMDAVKAYLASQGQEPPDTVEELGEALRDWISQGSPRAAIDQLSEALAELRRRGEPRDDPKE